jgi:hypothetical protein
MVSWKRLYLPQVEVQLLVGFIERHLNFVYHSVFFLLLVKFIETVSAFIIKIVRDLKGSSPVDLRYSCQLPFTVPAIF